MNTGKSVVWGIVLVAVAVVVWWQYSLTETLRRDNEALRNSIAELRRLQEAREPVSSSESPTREQLDELSSLQSEATRLRERTNQIAGLVEANQKLAASLKQAQTQSQPAASKKKNPEDALPQDIHPKDSWAFRGYSTPETALESLCLAIVNKDKAMIADAFTPELQSSILQSVDKGDFGGDLEGMTEFRILDRQQISDDKMILSVYATWPDANGKKVGDSENAVFHKIGGQWKMANHGSPND